MKKVVIAMIVITSIIVGSVLVSRLTNNDSTSNTGTSESSRQSTSSPSTSDSTTSTKVYTLAEVAEKDTRDDCWIIIEGGVYDVGSYLDKHPGGEGQITPFCGKDATQAFKSRGGEGTHSESANTIKQEYFIGTVQN